MNETGLAGLTDILAPLPPVADVPWLAWVWTLAGLSLVITAVWYWRRRRHARPHLLRTLARDCEAARIDPRQAAHRIAHTVAPPPATSVQITADWAAYWQRLNGLRFAREPPCARAVAAIARQAVTWLETGHDGG